MESEHTFADAGLDRAAHLRTEDWLKDARSADDSRTLLFSDLRPLIAGSPPRLGWLATREADPFLADPSEVIFLGLSAAGSACFAASASAVPEIRDHYLLSVRTAATEVPAAEAGVLAQARSMLSWHQTHRFCAVCGQPTQVSEGGYSRRCSVSTCAAMHFPRTDPVAIMLVVRNEYCLLGRSVRSPRYPPGLFSCLAGFVEPGESLEEAVRREVLEEAGLRVAAVTYMSSQPWPFPSNLMLGCLAETTEERIRVDESEIEEARWFSRSEARAMVSSWNEAGRLRVPPPITIAHHLVAHWAG